MTTNRMTIPEARKVAQKYDLKIVQANEYIGEDDEGYPVVCAVGLSAVRAAGLSDAEKLRYDYRDGHAEVAEVTGMSPEYLIGLEIGFEDFGISYDTDPTDHPDFKTGISDGIRLRKTVQHGRLPGRVVYN